MKELERIIEENIDDCILTHNGWSWRKGGKEQFDDAISQFVIKARISELENLCSSEDIVTIDEEMPLYEYITQLKKGLK